MTGLKVGLVIAYALYLTWKGLSPKVGLCSWHMFARADRGYMDLYSDPGYTHVINPWDYVPHSSDIGEPVIVKEFLAFLKDHRGLSAWGTVIVDMPEGRFQISIAKSSFVEIVLL